MRMQGTLTVQMGVKPWHELVEAFKNQSRIVINGKWCWITDAIIGYIGSSVVTTFSWREAITTTVTPPNKNPQKTKADEGI